MSDATEIEKEQQAPTMREAETGPLLPRWFMILFYATFAPLCAFALIAIARSIYVQSHLTGGVGVVLGGVDGLVDLDGPEGRRTREYFDRHPLDAFLYVTQELLRDEVDDPRMARVLALRKAIQWGETSSERGVIETIVDSMGDDGIVPREVRENEEIRSILTRMVRRRRADTDTTYAEDRVTSVLEWVADGCPGQPTGPEKRRMQALARQYEKAYFVGAEGKALAMLVEEWTAEGAGVAKECAERFKLMLEGTQTELSEEDASYCKERADSWEASYSEGMVRGATMARQMLEKVVGAGTFIDHPYVYQYLNLLGHRLEGVREQVAAGAWALRHNKYCLRFLALYATRTAINPVMAVETVRLTKEEHERIMRRANDRRLRGAAALLGRIGVDYVENTDEYELDVRDPQGFVRSFVVHPLQEVEDEEVMGDIAASALAAIRQADLKRPGGPLFFGAAAETETGA